MFDFGEILKPQVDALRPHLTSAQEMLCSIRDLLGSIDENTRDKPFTPDHDRLSIPFQVTVSAIATPPFTYAEVISVPPTEDWEIENLRAGVTTGSAVLHLYDTNSKGSGDAPLAAATVGDISSTNGIVAGNGVVIVGGTRVWAVATAGAAGPTINGVLQVRRRRRVPAHPGHGGDMLPGPSGDAETPKAEPSRHVGTWTTQR